MNNRLKFICELARGCNCLLDVGTDHGYLPVFMIENEYANMAIVSDISKDSLQKARNLVLNKKLVNKIECRLGNGLEVIKENDNIDSIVIAGMGGNLITQIIDKKIDYLDKNITLYLQPMQNPEVLRKYLLEKGFSILGENLVEDEGKIYQIITSSKSLCNSSYDDVELEFGKKDNYKTDTEISLLNSIISKKKEEVLSIIEKIKNSNYEKKEEKIEEYNNYYKRLSEFGE